MVCKGTTLLLINLGSDLVVLPVLPVSAGLVTQTVVVAPEANRSLPEHLEDIVAGSHPSLGDEGWATLHKYTHVFPALGEPVTGHTTAVQHDIETNGPYLFGVGHVAWHRLVSELNRPVLGDVRRRTD